MSLVEVLPKSIEKLALVRCGGKELQYLQKLLILRKEMAPVLKFVYLSYCGTVCVGYRFFQAEKLEVDFKAAGIELVIDVGHRRSMPRYF